jgi:hypothetical protein
VRDFSGDVGVVGVGTDLCFWLVCPYTKSLRKAECRCK